MNILITGGAGFIGSHLAEKLIKQGHKIVVIDNLSTGSLANIKHLQDNPNFELHIGSILDWELIESLISKCQIVYHMAAAVGVKYIIENPLLSLRTNIVGTENILELCHKYNCKVLVASTSEIYGKSDNIPFNEEDDRLLGSTHISRWGYSTSKAVDEFFALAFHREKKLPVVIVRLFNTVGPRQTGQYGMVIPKFIKAALLDQPIIIYGTGKQSRCFTDVDDVSDALIKLMSTPKCEGNIYNVGSKEPITIEELAHKIKKAAKSNSKIEYMAYEDAFEDGFEDMMKRMPDIGKIEEAIGYKRKHTLDKIIERVIDFYEE
ncbi:MAG: nucleoside-diphosphate sugar epimerase [Candidatus Cloacimonetes bacterium 4572_65]|nr:MAG: nucleoside-diphosphate sugar epimerase [Candidatus Cloacimonetes bacterium 4572_65]